MDGSKTQVTCQRFDAIPRAGWSATVHAALSWCRPCRAGLDAPAACPEPTMSLAYNLARFDLISIRLAVACAQTGSLTAAARNSHLALAAASRRIRELENALGDTLFERHTRGLLPTPAGRVFVKHGLALLQTMEQLGGELADLRQGIARHIRLCASSAAISQF